MRGQQVVAVAAGGIVGLVRAPVLLGTSLATHALHVPMHVTVIMPVCLPGGLKGRSHAESATRQTNSSG